MCGICGFLNFETNLLRKEQENLMIAHRMAKKLRHRGPDAWGEWVGEHAVLAHSRLAVIDVENGLQPMKRTFQGHEFVITYNGELYNTDDLRRELLSLGYELTTSSDTEVLLYLYIHYGEACAQRLNGIYAFVIWDSMRRRVFASYSLSLCLCFLPPFQFQYRFYKIIISINNGHMDTVAMMVRACSHADNALLLAAPVTDSGVVVLHNTLCRTVVSRGLRPLRAACQAQ